MKIAWINDFKTGEITGGNNKTSSIIIEKGRSLGYEITEISPSDLFNKELEDQFTQEDKETLKKILIGYDLLILNNINYFKTEVIDWIIHNTKYIKYEHDYCYCQFRNGCVRCKPKCEPAKIFVDLFTYSLKNIFFSPMQLDIFKKAFGNMILRDAIYLPAPMIENSFYPDKNIQQKNAYLFAGALQTAKGVHQILDYADIQKGTGKVFHFAGRVISKEIMERIKKSYHYLGEIDSDEMAKLYRKYEYFIFNPQLPESFCHTLLEALASGCKVIKFQKSMKTGLESYNLSPQDILKECYTAPDKFWKIIDEVYEDV